MIKKIKKDCGKWEQNCFGYNLLNFVKLYFNGGFWRNERLSDVDEYTEYINSK